MTHFTCTNCRKTHTITSPRWRCDCGGLLDINFTPHLDVRLLKKRKPNLWRYREAIPLPPEAGIISFDEGFTPLLPVNFDGREVWVKQDQLFGTGSYKDRGAAVLISQAAWLGVNHVVEDSSGNAGCAVAAYCARAGISCDIYVPADNSPAKLAQIARYGANLKAIPGSREDTAAAVMQAAENSFYASHSWNPFFFHGTKTWAYEVCEQLGWQAPDTVILPAGNGTLLLGAAIGFKELFQMGLIKRRPRLVAVQAAGCAPLVKMFNEDLNVVPAVQKTATLAEGIAIAAPVRGAQMVAAVRESGGFFISVDEGEIKTSLLHIHHQGYFIEPTSAAVTAGVSRYVAQHAAAGEMIVSTFTGHGLKAGDKIAKL
ncbi:MAG: threonine synthase [Anaerolineae bacterium]|nr:threonine synthase [Anaerolineae bacterium]